MEMTTKLNDTVHLIKDVQLSHNINNIDESKEKNDNEFTSNKKKNQIKY